MNAILEPPQANRPRHHTLVSRQVYHLDFLAAAPGGVARLRDLILTLAVRGKLVAQCASDEPAEQHLADARAAMLVRGPRAGKPLRERNAVSDSEGLFTLPRGWTWCRLGDLAFPQAGFAFKSAGFNELNRGKPLIRIRDVGSAYPPMTHFDGEFREEFLVEPGEWLISMDGEFRVRSWHGPTALLNQRVTRLLFYSPKTMQSFVTMALQKELSSLQGAKAYTTVDHLSGKQIADAIIALPPEAEQVRIVRRVDELMDLCDALEANGRLEAEQHARLLDALLGSLTSSTSPEELATNWQRVAAHFDLLLDRQEAVDAVEEVIVELAIRGVLVPQRTDEGDARALLQAIRAQAADLAANRKAKPRTAKGLHSDAAPRFHVPPTWIWARLEELAMEVVDCPHSTPKFLGSGLLCIDTNSFKGGKLLLHKLRFVDQSTFEERTERLRPLPGDLVFAREGSVGESLIIPPGTVACLGQRVMLFRFSRLVSTEFIQLAISSREFLDMLLSLHKGIGAKHVNVGDMRHAAIPLPPLAEQLRIVARVGQLRRLCSDLREKLTTARELQTRLAEALVQEAAQAPA